VAEPGPRRGRRPRPTGNKRAGGSERTTTDATIARPNRSAKGSATQNQILAAARVVFGRMGYGGTRMEDIATAAGVSRPTLYHYYATRQEIFIELGRTATRSTKQVIAAARALPTEWTRADLAHLIDAHLQHLDEHGTLIYTWIQATWDNPELQELGLSVQLHDFKAVGIELARLRGTSDVDATLEGMAFLGMIDRVWYYANVGGAPIDDKKMRHMLLLEAEGFVNRSK
jgi:AcrR family transcriptional regulator